MFLCGAIGYWTGRGGDLNGEMNNLHPFYSWAGIDVVEATEGESYLELRVQDHHRGGGGTDAINGGIVAYLFDGILGAAVRSAWPDDVVRHVTITLNIQYHRLLRVKHTVIGRGHVTQFGGTTVFAAGEVYDDAGLVAATCTGVYRVFRRA